VSSAAATHTAAKKSKNVKKDPKPVAGSDAALLLSIFLSHGESQLRLGSTAVAPRFDVLAVVPAPL
jgi:hypothetical protein